MYSGISLLKELTFLYFSKQCDLVVTWDAHTQDATDVRFGPNASYIASVSNDRTLKFYMAN